MYFKYKIINKMDQEQKILKRDHVSLTGRHFTLKCKHDSLKREHVSTKNKLLSSERKLRLLEDEFSLLKKELCPLKRKYDSNENYLTHLRNIQEKIDSGILSDEERQIELNKITLLIQLNIRHSRE